MRYDLILVDSTNEISDSSLDFVRKLQQFLELNFKDKLLARTSISNDFLAPLDELEIIDKVRFDK